MSVFGLDVPLLGLWFILATIVALVTERIDDWNDMTDELVWERLAVSIGQTHSLLPRLHGEVIRSLSQLYPLLVSPFFWRGQVPGDLRNAHVFNAWLMTSAAIPAFLLARRVTGRRWPAYTLALVTVCTPWLIYSTAVLTEVAAYPAFVWAAFAMHRTLTNPSKRNDGLALLTLALAFFARTQFSLLLGVLPVALVLFLFTSQPGTLAHRVRETVRRGLGEHLVLVGTYVALGLAALGYVATGHHLTQLTVYGKESHPSVLTTATAGSMTGHAADLAFGIGILPLLAGVAWLFANLVRPPVEVGLRAFACLGATTLVVLLAIVSAWDLTIGTFVLDRYLFYLVPILVLGFLCALRDARRPRWSLLIPVGVVSYGFATHLQQSFLWSPRFPLSFDSPVAPGYRLVLWLGGGRGAASAILVAATIGLAALFVLAGRIVRHATLTAVLATVLAVAFPADTFFTFHELLSKNGHSGRPLTQSEKGVLDWLDQSVGTAAVVTEVPYPVSDDFFVTQESWRDLEFWNKSVRYDVHYPTPDVYDDAVVWFPNTPLTFNPNTGAASASWSPYAVQSINESRFWIAGNEQLVHGDTVLIDAEMPWRTEWLTSGLYDDGWMEPHATARIRVFSEPGQKQPVTRTLNLQIQTTVAQAPYTLRSNLATIQGTASSAATTFKSLTVCVPVHGYAEASLSTPLVTTIPGDQKNQPASTVPRQGGVRLADLSLSDDLGPPCGARGGGGGGG